MKKITLEKGIINLCRNSSNWIIYYNPETRRAWCMVYADGNSWTDYYDRKIYPVMSGTGEHSIFGWDGLTRRDIYDAIEREENYRAAVNK